MSRFAAILLFCCVVMRVDSAQAQATTSYSGTVTISGKTIPLMLRGGSPNGTGRYLFAGQSRSAPAYIGDPGIAVTANLFEHESTVKMLLFVTPPGSLGPLYTGRYETTPPMVGGLTLSLAGGYGVWSPAMPASISLTSGP